MNTTIKSEVKNEVYLNSRPVAHLTVIPARKGTSSADDEGFLVFAGIEISRY